ncbi:D-aminoacyl-tRNA deacylase, partial [Streptococcus agalactiae]
MKIIIQRVSQASVSIEDDVVGSIEKGLVLLVGIAPEDTTEDIAYAVRKITSMYFF